MRAGAQLQSGVSHGGLPGRTHSKPTKIAGKQCLTKHPVDDVKNQMVLGVLNFEPRNMGAVVPETLILGVQFPKAESGEATFRSPLAEAKIGGKLF